TSSAPGSATREQAEREVKARYLGIIFVAAVLVPSVFLSVLSIRSAGREEAYVEKQLATTLLAEVTHTASLVNAGVDRLADELHASVAFPTGSAYQRALTAWKGRDALVGVPYVLSPEYGILWPWPGNPSTQEERAFLRQNADFLSGKSATAVFANIAVVHKEQVLAEARRLGAASQGAAMGRASPTGAAAGSLALAAPGSEPAASAEASKPAESSELESQQAIDTFAQSPAVQASVYKEARKQGQQLNARVAQPTSKALPANADLAQESADAPAPADKKDTAPTSPPAGQPSQYITTSRLLSEIASKGEYGIIPRFIGDRLTFLFWDRLPDRRIVGCEIAPAEFRQRVEAILPSTYSAVRILTVLDESGQPLATPAGVASRDWRRPFVSQEIGSSLPRWEVASYLTDPGSIAAQARSTSAVIWILVLILFVSVAGGGTMVLTSLYGEMRLAQKKASFVANVSHELKTPLTSISLFIDLLRRKRQPAPEKRDRYLAMMAAETERLGRLINNVLDFSSQEKGKAKYAMLSVDVGQVAEEVVEGQRVRLEGLGFTVRFLAERPAERLFANADPGALKQVLINLLSNAEKYSPRQKELEVEAIHTGSEVAVHVRDRGIGVSEKDRERIFLEFVRVDDSLTTRVPGTGLGLTIARRIARDHGGDLTCQGRAGDGADFVLRLPAAAPDPEEQQ
ncbi:MAG: sensor histidine kinase, partial [Spirochaetia bacterium]